MFRLLICDDEPLISDGMGEIFSRDERLDVYCVYSSEGALEILNKIRIDIVILDIQMPGMNGLELLVRIKKTWAFCQVIMLTGHSNFQYIYEATSFPDVKYILKSEGYDKVIHTVASAVDRIEKQISDGEIWEKAQSQLKPMQNILKRDFLISMLKGWQDPILQTTCDLEMNLDMQSPVLLMVCRPFDDGSANPIRRQKLYQMANVIAMYVGTVCRYEMVVDENDLLYFFMQFLCEGESASAVLRGNLELAQASCKEVMETALSIMIEMNPIPWDSIGEKNDQLLTLLNVQTDSGRAMYISEAIQPRQRDEVFGAEEEGESISSAKREFLFHALNRGNEDEFLDVLHEIQASVSTLHSIHSLVAQERYYAVALSLMTYINKHSLGMRLAFETSLYKLAKIDAHENWAEAFLYLEDLSRKIFKLRAEEITKNENEIVLFIKKHVRQNLHDPDKLTLLSISEMLFFNPSYLSRLFKQITGETLTDYISGCRMAAAKKMLTDSDAKIAEIAEAVGYGIPANFTRIFRKIVGQSPNEYRMHRALEQE